MLTKLTKTIYEGCSLVARKVCNLDFVMEEAEYDRSNHKHDGSVVSIGFFGDCDGEVSFSFEDRLARKMASILIGDSVPDMTDTLAQSALGEICNMIMGNTLGLLSERHGIYLDITPPSIETNGQQEMSFKCDKRVTVPVTLDGERKMNMCITIPCAT